MISTVLLILAAICFGIAAVNRSHSVGISLVPAGLFLVTLALLLRGVTIE